MVAVPRVVAASITVILVAVAAGCQGSGRRRDAGPCKISQPLNCVRLVDRPWHRRGVRDIANAASGAGLVQQNISAQRDTASPGERKLHLFDAEVEGQI